MSSFMWKNLFYMFSKAIPGTYDTPHTFLEGWAYLEHVLWPKLQPFEDHARAWFGHDKKAKLQRMILCNDARNRLDICLRCPKTRVGMDYVSEPGYPLEEVPAEFWL